MKLQPAAFELPEPIRPRPCTWRGPIQTCPNCGGVGFLYPELADSVSKRAFCRDVWDTLGLGEVSTRGVLAPWAHDIEKMLDLDAATLGEET